MSSGRKGAWIFIFAVMALLYLASDGVEFMVDYAWFDAQGRLGVFKTIFFAQFAVGLALGTVVFLLLLLTLLFALRQIGDPGEFLPQEILITPLGQFLTGRLLARGAVLFSLAAAAVAGMAAAN